MIGMEIGCYRILDKLGQGGMGVVYKALDTGLDRMVAMKVLNPDLSKNPELVTRFQSEAKAQANLNHTNLATLYAFLVHDGTAIMVMEFVEGETFAQIIRRRGPIPEREAIPIFMQALLGIGYAHRAGIIHRDIKPSNLMMNKNGIVKVMDFGIAKVMGARGLTRTGAQLGTLAYMSPEQIQNRNVDIRSDIYELGITLYEMLTGHLPFEGDSEFQVMQDQVFKPPPLPSIVYPYIGKGIENVILKSIEKEPDRRFQTVEQFGAALEHPESLVYTPTTTSADDASTASLSATSPFLHPAGPTAPPTPSGARTPYSAPGSSMPPASAMPSTPSAPRPASSEVPSAARPMAPTVPATAAPPYSAPTVAATRVSSTVAQPPTQMPVPTATVAPPAPAGVQKKWIIIGVCAVLVLILGGVAAYQTLTPTSSRAPSSATAPSNGGTSLADATKDATPTSTTPIESPPESPASNGSPNASPSANPSTPAAPTPTPKPRTAAPQPAPVQPAAQPPSSQPQPAPAVKPAENGQQLWMRAQAALNQSRIFEPTNDCALYWAIQSRRAGNPGGKALEEQIVKHYKERVGQDYQSGNYGEALVLVKAMLKFYPNDVALLGDLSRIQAASNSSAH
jgi:serine/threonine protein kinase